MSAPGSLPNRFWAKGKGQRARLRGERAARTSATSKIFLNCMFVFTFTVTSVRTIHKLVFHRDRREDARIPVWLIMRLSLGFESSGSAIATGGKGLSVERWFWFKLNARDRFDYLFEAP